MAAVSARQIGIHTVKSASSKALHVRILPAPANLAESKEILNVLRRYGDISAYRSLKWEPKSPSPEGRLAIYKDAGSAQKLLRESPLQFTLETIGSEDRTEAENPMLDLYNELEARHNQPDANNSADNKTNQSPLQTPDPVQTTENEPSTAQPRHFLVYARPWGGDLDIAFAHAPYTGGFSLDARSPAQQELVRSVPLPGLSMIELGRSPVPTRLVQKRQDKLQNRKTLRQLMNEDKDRASEVGSGGMDSVSRPGVSVDNRYSYEPDSAMWSDASSRSQQQSTEQEHSVDDALTEAGWQDQQDSAIPEGTRKGRPAPWTRNYERMI